MSDKILVTVQGVDKIGIVAKITATLAQFDVNIDYLLKCWING